MTTSFNRSTLTQFFTFAETILGRPKLKNIENLQENRNTL